MVVTQDIRRQIGEQLRVARKDRKDTQEQTAHKIGVSRQMVNRYENGHALPSTATLAKIMRHFGVDLEISGHRLTIAALEQEIGSTQDAEPEQFVLPFGERQFENATIRIVRTEEALEFHAVIVRS